MNFLSHSRQTLPSVLTVHTADERSDTSDPTKYSIFYLSCSQLRCDPIGRLTKVQCQPNYAYFPPFVSSAGSGPFRTLTIKTAAALQLHQTGLSGIPRHFEMGVTVGGQTRYGAYQCNSILFYGKVVDRAAAAQHPQTSNIMFVDPSWLLPIEARNPCNRMQ